MLSSAEHINSILFSIAFIMIVIIVSVVVLFVTFNNRKNKLIQENLSKELEVQKRQHKIELKTLRSQMNPHFVYNSLNAIQYYIQRNEVETSEKYLAKFSILMRQFFEYSRRQHVSIQEEISLLNNYLEIEKLRFEEKLSFKILVDKKIDKEEQIIPSMMLQPLVENAVNHGLFHKTSKGTVIIYFQYLSKDTFKVTVTDDGIGVKKAKKIDNLLAQSYQENSSSVLQERLELLKQSKDWFITYKIKDADASQIESGTKVSIIFKQP